MPPVEERTARFSIHVGVVGACQSILVLIVGDSISERNDENEGVG